MRAATTLGATVLTVCGLLMSGCGDPPPVQVVLQAPQAQPPPAPSSPNDDQHRLDAVATCIAFAKKKGLHGLDFKLPVTTFQRLTSSEFANAQGNPGDVARPPPGWMPATPQQAPPPVTPPPPDALPAPVPKPLLDCWRVSFPLMQGSGSVPLGTAARSHVFVIANDGRIMDSGEFMIQPLPQH